MTSESKPLGVAFPADGMVIRPIGVDDWAGVRYLHTNALRRIAGAELSSAGTEALASYVRTQEYADRLLLENLHTGWLDGELVGTAGWTPADDCGKHARITSVVVRPLFRNMGFGRRLVRDAEIRALSAGFQRLAARATLDCVGFFEKLDYDIASYGSHALIGDRPMPVVYMRKLQPDASIADAAVRAGRRMRAVSAGSDLDRIAVPPHVMATPRGR